jgi:poly-gamma-glutamate system protein
VKCITILLLVLVLNSKTKVEARYYEEKLHAAELSQRALGVIKNAVVEMGIPIDRINDPNETGIIGLQYSAITTERGDLDAKLTSTNPNFAALIVELLKDAGARKNDIVALSLTGSHPALNIGVLSAVKILSLKPIIITSVSSSMWGANYPQLTYLDMEAILMANGVFDFRTKAASLGGEDDIGRGMSPEGRELIEMAALRNNIPLLNAQNFDYIMEQKMDLYKSGGKIRIFVNAGERTTALAGTEADIGLLRPQTIRTGKGLVSRFSAIGVAVINLADINGLAQRYGLPVSPIPLPSPGDGRQYYEYRYSVTLAIIAAGILAVILFVVLRFDIDYYFKRRDHD